MRILCIAVLLLIIFSVLPFHNDNVDAKVECREVDTLACLTILEECNSLADVTDEVVDPLEEYQLKGEAGIALEKCLKQKYNPNCIDCTGGEITLVETIRKYGPWYLDYFPVVQQWWIETAYSFEGEEE